MAKIADFFVELGLRKEKFDKGMNEAGDAGKKLGNDFKQTGLALQAAFAAVAVGIGAILKQSLAAYDAQAKAEAGLLQALKGREYAQDILLRQATELQRTTLFGDESTVEAQKQLAVLGLTTKQIKELIPLVQDFATSQGMDLVQAAQLVGKAVATGTNALGRYGVELDSTMSMTQKAAEIQRVFNDRYGGQAAKAAQAGTGSVQQMTMAYGDLQEVLGGIVASNITGYMQQLKGDIEAMQKILGGTEGLANLFKRAFDASPFKLIWDYNSKILKLLGGSADESGEIELSMSERLAMAKESLEATKKEWETIKANRAEIELKNKAEADEKAKKAREEALKIAKETAQAHREGREAIESMYREMQAGVDAALKSGAGFSKLLEIDPYDLTQEIEEAVGVVEPIPIPINIDQMNEALAMVAERAQMFREDMAGLTEGFIEDMIVSFAEGFADLATGDTTLDQFFKGILGKFGGFIAQMGKLMIGYGIAMGAFKKAFQNPIGLVVAGAALVVIGKAISNLAAKGAEGSMTGGSGSTAGMTGGYGTAGGGYTGQGANGLGGIIATTQVKGSDLVFIFERANNNLNRIRP